MREYSILELQELFSKGELNSESLVQQYLERIDQVDSKINAIIEINPDALEIAKQRDNERKEGKIRGELHGIPIVVKDNIDTADKMMTTAGSLALEGNIAQNDAYIVSLLREKGAIILAKANLSEWANFRGLRSTSGWSSRGKQTHNPYALNRNPCGSSSGSAVAVAANLCTVAIGTETDGSIICPSHTNGIVGIKPSIGLTSRSGIIPIAHSQDTAGPMARTVTDAAILLGAMVGSDSKDPISKKAETEKKDYTIFLDANGLKGARLGISKKVNSTVPKIQQAMNKILDKLTDLGAEVVEFEEFPTVEGIGDSEFQILLYEYRHDLDKYLKNMSKEVKVHSIEELIAYNKLNADKIMPFYGQEHLETAMQKGDLESEEYVKAQEQVEELRKILSEFLEQNKLDALISPSGGPAWHIDHINGDCFSGGVSTSYLAAVTGFASITVPATYIQGLPMGISFIGTAFSESTLIKLAYAWEQATKIRQPPQLLDTIKTD